MFAFIKRVIVLALLAPMISAAVAQEDYEQRIERWLARRGLEAERSDAAELETLIERGFARVAIGLFDVRIPAHALSDPEWLDELKDAVQTILDVQRAWTEWLPAENGVGKLPSTWNADAKALAGWIRQWKTKKFANRDAVLGHDLLDVTRAKPKVRDASAALAEFMRGGGALGKRAAQLDPVRLILAPERYEFVEFAAVAGWLVPRYREEFWSPTAALWTFFDFERERVIALDYASPDSDQDYRRSIGMKEKNPDSRKEHVAQLAARSLLSRLYDWEIDELVAGSLANNLVIDLFGEVDTRTDGDSTARSKGARDLFIPGAIGPDGALPPNDADSHWRVSKGKDHFVDVLTKSQKAGGKSAEADWQTLASFVLVDGSGSNGHVVHAPFLSAGEPPPPDALRGEFAEFLRAYRIAFFHWLRFESSRPAKVSRTKFAAFLRRMSTDATDLPGTFEAVYATPLSGAGEALEASLEGEFLAWLTK